MIGSSYSFTNQIRHTYQLLLATNISISYILHVIYKEIDYIFFYLIHDKIFPKTNLSTPINNLDLNFHNY